MKLSRLTNRQLWSLLRRGEVRFGGGSLSGYGDNSRYFEWLRQRDEIWKKFFTNAIKFCDECISLIKSKKLVIDGKKECTKFGKKWKSLFSPFNVGSYWTIMPEAGGPWFDTAKDLIYEIEKAKIRFKDMRSNVSLNSATYFMIDDVSEFLKRAKNFQFPNPASFFSELRK